MPVTSRTLSMQRTRQPPSAYSLRLRMKTTKLIDPAMSMCVASTGRFSCAQPVRRDRLKTSIDEFAWIVDSDPSLPWLMALSMVTISSPRTSPTMTRLGFMRRLRRTSSAIVTPPTPSEIRQPLLHRDDVGVEVGLIEAKLECAFDGDDPLVCRDFIGKRPQQRRLPSVGGARNHDVLSGQYGSAEEGREDRLIVSLPTRSSRKTFPSRDRRMLIAGARALP